MSPQEIKLRLLQKVNKNLINQGISLDLPRAMYLYNQEAIRMVEKVIEQRDSDDIRLIQTLLENSKSLQKNKDTDRGTLFKLPKDYFAFITVVGYADKGGCKNKRIKLFEIKHENEDEVTLDENNEPSFKYREAPYTIGSDSVHIFRKDFDITKVLLSYYRYPRKVDIAGYVKEDGTQSKDIYPDLDDKLVLRIIDSAAKSFNLNANELQKIQFDKERIDNKF